MRKAILKKVKKYFKIWELVGPAVYNKYGERAWRFLDTDALHCLLVVREGLDSATTVNNWKNGGQFSQRGLRDNTQSILNNKTVQKRLYLSAHVRAKAFDFDVKGYTSVEVRKWIKDNADRFPCKIRLEQLKDGKEINWTHLDTDWEPQNPKVYFFNV